MNQVLAFHSRLKQANMRLQHSVSSVSIFEALEAATVQSAEFLNLSLKRDADNQFELSADIEADSFDASLFQRGVFERNKIIESVEIGELQINNEVESDGVGVQRSSVKFTATIGIPVASIPYLPSVPVYNEVPALSLEQNSSSTVSATTTEASQNTP
jgi:transketolase N-terminal domain/subunit